MKYTTGKGERRGESHIIGLTGIDMGTGVIKGKVTTIECGL